MKVVRPSNTSMRLIRFWVNCFRWVYIKFEDEVKTLILLSYLPLSLETMVSAISNLFGKEKLKYDDVRDLILN